MSDRSLSTRLAFCVAVPVASVLGLAFATAAPSMAEGRPEVMPYQTSGPIPDLDPALYRQQPTQLVRIVNHAIHPRLTRLRAGEAIAWISHSRFPTAIVFEREVAGSMVCHGLVNFSLVDDELRSASIHAGEYASFCELKPGRYRYRVIQDALHESAGESASGRVEGVIVVAEPS